MLVQKARTIVTLDELVVAMDDAFELVHGVHLEVVDLATLWGKLVTECGHPTPSQCCWCRNVGNIRGRSASGRYCLLSQAYEFRKLGLPLGPNELAIETPRGAAQPPGTYCYLPDPARQEFRAYETLHDACVEYAEVLGQRFKGTWRELVAIGTTPERFVASMKADGYFTGDVRAYAGSVASLARDARPRVEELLDRAAAFGAVEFLSDLSTLGPATPLRASEGEYTPRLDDVTF